ncbi:CDC42 small effector protein 2 isoform X1 [Sinocyclocheilus anshuiensis]|uniref:CDC42 small effector protein 2 isoform X1 n=1 Tax=Sinocyclocheilus anshuiensis TaxID=1608454 RepID=UPI0007B8BBEB|nr:PREDICTED: CDC42 small effector protein 2 isoform X1 [Sinocyclocheilus anshuiensis]
MSEFWLCFNCCIAEQPQPKRRRRIDRSMIGEPTNFVHTAHVGSGDIFSGMNSGPVMSCFCSLVPLQQLPMCPGGNFSPHSSPANTWTVVRSMV